MPSLYGYPKDNGRVLPRDQAAGQRGAGARAPRKLAGASARLAKTAATAHVRRAGKGLPWSSRALPARRVVSICNVYDETREVFKDTYELDTDDREMITTRRRR